jgi:hypothetical protein
VHRSLVLLSLLGCLSLGPAVASAQEGGAKIHVGAGLALDVGGDVDFDPGPGDDLDATFGLRGHLDYQLHRFVSVGGLVRMSWWEPDEYQGIDRSFLFDLGPRIIGHYDWRDFRFYGGISPGLTISAINDDDWVGVGVDNPAAGFTLSITVAGAEWWFSRRLGLFAEIGYVGHWFEHELEGRFPGGQGFDDVRGDLEFSLGQMLFETGLVFGI